MFFWVLYVRVNEKMKKQRTVWTCGTGINSGLFVGMGLGYNKGRIYTKEGKI